jgi:tetratricopeptide (TPR) repeat protein
MLPDRSKRYAGIDGEIPRLVLASYWQLGLVALLVLALLVLIFPRSTLVEKLYEQDVLDDLTLSYVQNMYRADAKNPDVAILLTRSQQDTLDLPTIESRLQPLLESGNSRQRTHARVMLMNAYEKALATDPKSREIARLRNKMTGILQQAAMDTLTAPLAQRFASAAFALHVPRLGHVFLAQIGPGSTAAALAQYGQAALGKGEYSLAAEYFLLARDQTRDREEARRMFRQGVDAYMANSQFKQAMQEAEQHLGDLADDPVTLRYLARTALAAGALTQAAHYARQLVFQPPEPQKVP